MKQNKSKPKGKNARSNNHSNNKKGPAGQPSRGSEVNTHLSNRSASSVEKGGENEEIGEPAEGYGTVAPGIQGGG